MGLRAGTAESDGNTDMVSKLKYSGRDEWLAMRRNYIGGSDAGAVVGLDSYKSPYSLWAEKTGRVPEFAGNITTRVGSYLEPLVADMFMEQTGKKVRNKNAMLVNDKYPFACADLDRVVCGEKALLEIKTTNSFPAMRKVRGGEFPDRWWCQVSHYMAVSELEKAYLAVLVNCREYYMFELERDDSEIGALMDAEREFWERVKTDTPPPVDGAEATSEAIKTIYEQSVGTDVDLFGRDDLLDEYTALKQEQAEIAARMEAIQNLIKIEMGDAERGVTGRYTVNWKTQVRNTFQTKQFVKDHPEIDMKPYYKQSVSRPFKVTAIQEG